MQLEVGCVVAGLCRSIEVAQRYNREAPVDRARKVAIQCFPAADQVAQRAAILQIRLSEQGAQRSRNHQQDRDPLFAQRAREVRHISMLTRAGKYDRRSRQQWREELPKRCIEADRCLLQYAIEARQMQLLDGPADVIDEPAVRDEHPFGAARRAGRVNDVRALFGRARHSGVRTRSVSKALAVGVHAQHYRGSATCRCPQVLEKGLLGEHYGRGGIPQHELQSLARIFRVERHERAACLEHCEDRHHELEGTFQADANRNVAPHAEAEQMMRELICPGIQLRIRELLLLENYGDRIRPLSCLLRNQLVHAFVERVRTVGFVPLNQNALALGVGQQRQSCQRTVGGSDHRGQQSLEMRCELLNRGALEQIDAVFELPGERSPGLCQRQPQVVLGET